MDATSSSTVKSFVPEVDEPKTPKLGMVFADLDQAFNFYNSYAKDGGFSVRKSSNKIRNGETIWKQFVCSKQGHTDVKIQIINGVVQRRRSETREDCGARLQVKRIKPSEWVVSKFVAEHSHTLTAPYKTHLLRSHRTVSNAKEKVVERDDSSNVRQMNQTGVFDVQADVKCENIEHAEKDVGNYCRDGSEETKGQDAQMLHDHFKDLKEMNPAFIFNIEKDGDDRITHVFWADPTFRRSYCQFGDLVSFEIAYETNCYQLIFAAFTGLNHHGQPILLGCGLLPNETFDSFMWLFNKWLEAMPGGPPKAIITDQGLAMTKAIQFVMPTTTCHSFCPWRILDKLHVKLGGIAIHKEGFLERFNHCIFKSETEGHFELTWNKILKEFDIADNNWLTDLYNIRGQWVPIFSKHVFFGGMSTTQRCKSIDVFVKQYISQKNSLYDFILRFERGVARQKFHELKADHDTVNGKLKLKTSLPMEKQMAEIYTREMFFKFQEELMLTISYQTQLVKDNAEESNYLVSSLGDGNEIQRLVIFKKEVIHASCTCQMFESEGIPCRHVICVLKQEGIAYLPQHYILKRWTRHAREDGSGVKMGAICDDSLVARHSDLSFSVTSIIDEASLSKQTYHYVKDIFAEIQQKVREMNFNEGTIAKDHKKKRKDGM